MKKLFIWLLCLFLFISPPIKTYASAGTIAVSGGTIAVGGLAGASLAGLAGPAVVCVFCAMMAVGLDVELTQASQEAGMTKTQYVKSKIEQYCSEAQITAGVFYKGILDGTQVLKNGSIELSNQAMTQIKQFCTWLFENNMVNEPVTGSGEGTVSLGGLNAPVLSVGEQLMLCSSSNQFGNTASYVIYNSGTNEAIAIIATVGTAGSSSYWYWAISNSNSNANINYFSNQNTNISWYGPVNGYYRAPLGNYTSVINTDIPIYTGYTVANIANLLNSWDGTFNPNMTNTGVVDGFTGTRDEYNRKVGDLGEHAGYDTVVNPRVIGNIPIPADTDITVSVRDYLDALQRVLDKLQDRDITGTDKADAIPRDYDIPDTVEADPDIEIAPDDTVPDDDKTPVTSDDPVNPETEPNISAAPLKFDLRNIFPFCIPFDIKDMIGLLSADPVAPSYTVDWEIPFVNTNLTFTVDLSGYDDVAEITRNMELLLFMIGLAVVTRNLIRG